MGFRAHQVLFCVLSIVIFLSSPVVRKYSSIYIASYLSHPLDYYEVDKSNLIMRNGCISVGIANDVLHLCRTK